MSDDLVEGRELAEAAERGRRIPHIKVPDYEAITTGSALFRFFAFLAIIAGVLIWFGGGFYATTSYLDAQRGVRAAEARLAAASASTQPSYEPWYHNELAMDVTLARLKMAAAIWSGVGAFFSGVGFFAVAAVLRMVAFLAIAIRDLARNSYFLRIENALYGR